MAVMLCIKEVEALGRWGWTILCADMALECRDSACLTRDKGDGSWCSVGKYYSRLHLHHVIVLVLMALASLGALLTTVTPSRLLPGPSAREGVPVVHDPQWRSNLPTRPGYDRNGSRYGSIANDSTFLAFVMSEPGAEHEKHMIKGILEESLLDPFARSGQRAGGISGRRPSRLPSPNYAPFWPQYRALLRARMAMKRYDPTVLQSLLVTIKEPIDRHHQSRHPSSEPQQQQRRFASCAVVGNSGIVLSNTYGEAIDAHEAVVRLNNARARGFEKHVGHKTTISFMTSNILHNCARRLRCYCQAYDDDEDVAIVTYISQVPHLMDVVVCKPVRVAPVLVTDPRFDALTARIAKYYSVREFVARTNKRVSDWPWRSPDPAVETFHYSSGMQAVMMALGICEAVDLYGFGKAEGVRHHYHSPQGQELDIHDYPTEYLFYDELASPATRDTIPFLRDAGIPLPRVRVFG